MLCTLDVPSYFYILRKPVVSLCAVSLSASFLKTRAGIQLRQEQINQSSALNNSPKESEMVSRSSVDICPSDCTNFSPVRAIMLLCYATQLTLFFPVTSTRFTGRHTDFMRQHNE